MRNLKVLALSALFVSTGAFANEGSVPEYFYQPEEGESAVEFGVGYKDLTESSLNKDEISPRLSAMHGIMHGLALRAGVSYTYADDANGGNGFNNLDLDLVGHHGMGGMTLHYGVEGSITPTKTGSQRFGEEHVFVPYVGVSMGEHCKYGAKFSYNSFTSSGLGGVTGDDYTVSAFGEWDKEDRYLLGLAVNYDQASGADDAVTANVYGRVYMEKFTLLPRLNYTMEMDGADEDGFGLEIAARFMF
ncbi:MAG: hypothetical protein ACRBBP_00860 [Bdellovibrionales bacterium]